MTDPGPSTRCPQGFSEEALSNYAYRLVDDEQEARAEAHLRECDHCVRILGHEVDTAIALVHKAGITPPASKRRTQRSYAAWALGMAAVLLIGLLLWKQAPEPLTTKERARVAWKEGRTEEAVALCRQIVANGNQDGDEAYYTYWFYIARDALQRGEPLEAAEAARQATLSIPDPLPEHWDRALQSTRVGMVLLRARALYKAQRPGEARVVEDRARALATNIKEPARVRLSAEKRVLQFSPWRHLSYGPAEPAQLRADTDQLVEVGRQLYEMTKDESWIVDTSVSASKARLILWQLEGAPEDLRSARDGIRRIQSLRVGADNPLLAAWRAELQATVLLAESDRDTGRLLQAVAEFERARSLYDRTNEKRQPDLHMSHGIALACLGRHDQAETQFNRAAAQSSGQAWTNMILAVRTRYESTPATPLVPPHTSVGWANRRILVALGPAEGKPVVLSGRYLL